MIKMYESIFSENAEIEMDEKKTKKEADPAEQILEILSSKQFSKWYEGEFAEYKEGEKDAPSKEDILEDIRSTFITEIEEKEAEKAEKEEKPKKDKEDKEKEEDELDEDAY